MEQNNANTGTIAITRLKKYFIAAFVLLIFLAFMVHLEPMEYFENSEFNEKLTALLLSVLVHDNSKITAGCKNIQNEKSVVYILGGDQISLSSRFEIAADLQSNGVVHKILLLDVPGITEYDPIIKRNLTNREWATRELHLIGVNSANLEFIRIDEGLFGTFSEGIAIAQLVRKRRYRKMILITSQYHTRRVWITFSKFLEGSDVRLYIEGSKDKVKVSNLTIELLKFLVYEKILLPIYFLNK